MKNLLIIPQLDEKGNAANIYKIFDTSTDLVRFVGSVEQCRKKRIKLSKEDKNETKK